MSKIVLTLEEVDPRDLWGHGNDRINIIKKNYPEVVITSRGSELKLNGDKKQGLRVKELIEKMIRMVKNDQAINAQIMEDLIRGGTPDTHHLPENGVGKNSKNIILHGRNGKPIKARTKNQRKLIDLSEDNDVVFAIGPAGTGKTYTAVALAVKALKNRLVKKIILTRPAVEAGESLGFLPGDLKDKIDPYLRPLYDALDDMIPVEKLTNFMENRIIEVAPLAFMRGRTLDNAFIILDEAQNCTSTQIKMFLTRLGPSAKCIVTGDLSQIDLPRNQTSGLSDSLRILGDLNGIGILHLNAEDVVRHRLVKEIIKRYQTVNNRKIQESNIKTQDN